MPTGPLVGIVAAAGSGERLGAGDPKAFVPCAGRPLLEWSIAALEPVCDRVIAVVPAELAGADHAGGLASEVERVAGGPSRSQSVRSAVLAAPDAGRYLVQDAARPLATAELAGRCAAVLDEGWDGAVAAARVTDTIKQADGAGRVRRTLDRSTLWAIQTPQAFDGDALRGALDAGEATLAAASDDAALVEAAGGSVTVVEAPAWNLKVTDPDDLELAELLLARRRC